MLRTTRIAAALAAAAALTPLLAVHGAAPGTSFTYQGLLEEAGAPVTTVVDVRFTLYNDAGGTSQVGSPITVSNVTPDEGVFSASLDFGAAAFASNEALWLRVEVSPAGAGTYDDLGLQPLEATPFALNTRGIEVAANGNVLLPDAVLTVDLPPAAFAPDGSSVALTTPGGYPGLAMSIGDGLGGVAQRWDQYIQGLTFRIRDTTAGIDRVTIDTAGNVGIGTSSPNRLLHVGGESRFDGRVGIGGATFGSETCGITHIPGDTFAFRIKDSSNAFPWFSIDADATVSCYGALNLVNGNQTHRIGPTGFGNVALTIDTGETWALWLQNGNAAKPGGGSWASSSDRNLKKNIRDLDGSLDTLLKLRGVTFEYKDPEAIGELAGTRTGFIAQEVERVIPDWVADDHQGYKTVTVRGFEAMAVEAMRELKSENDELRGRIAALEERLESASAPRVVTSSLTWPALGALAIGGIVVARRRKGAGA